MKLKLNAIFGKTFVGLAIDQIIGSYSSPITAYYFWPQTEAWEQLNLALEGKPWIQGDEKIKILNSVTKLMNFCMQKYNNTNSMNSLKEYFTDINFVE
jgi:30S ribosomal protein 3